jgi:hypothetical protein
MIPRHRRGVTMNDPTQMLPFRVSETQRQQFFIDNARALYRA